MTELYLVVDLISDEVHWEDEAGNEMDDPGGTIGLERDGDRLLMIGPITPGDTIDSRR